MNSFFHRTRREHGKTCMCNFSLNLKKVGLAWYNYLNGSIKTCFAMVITAFIFTMFWNFLICLSLYFTSNQCFSRSFIKRQTSGTSSDNQWQRVVQWVKTNDNERQQMTNNGTTSGATSENEWQRVTISANFSFFQIREKPTTKHPKENSLNLEDNLWRRPIELRAETSP